MILKDYLVNERNRAINENYAKYGWTSECKAKEPYVYVHKHDYLVDEFGNGWTGPADRGNSHIHQIINGKVVMDGDGHTHKLGKPQQEGPDTMSFGPTVVLQNPRNGYGRN